jgi:hypothetical protein
MAGTITVAAKEQEQIIGCFRQTMGAIRDAEQLLRDIDPAKMTMEEYQAADRTRDLLSRARNSIGRLVAAAVFSGVSLPEEQTR